MNKFASITAASALSILVAGSIVSPAYAWHPQGKITKSVQNVTSEGTLQQADTAQTAVSAKPGDVLNYVVVVSNTAAPATKHYNDLAFTAVTDSLPAGVVLVSNTSTRQLKQDLGTILPGASKTVTYQVKVTSTTNGAVILNKACFTANSVVKDNPQQGCDDANVKVNVPVVTPPVVTPPVTPPVVTPPTPTPVVVTPVEAVEPEALPSVGPSALAPFIAVGTTIAGYVGYLVRTKRRISA